jgi:UDP-N-acetylglucosamine enolpyruvyl transferase
MAAALLIKGKVTLKNVPEIQDVFTYLDILNGI